MAANIGTFQQVEKLHATNYETWKIQMKCTLKFNELWDYVTGDKQRPKENAEIWKAKDEKGPYKPLPPYQPVQPCEERHYLQGSMG